MLVESRCDRQQRRRTSTAGVGFWLDAVATTPTFRVGNPAGNRLSWDGTNLTVGQGAFGVDSLGVHITPADSNNYSTVRSYGFTVASGELGVGGNDGTTNGRTLLVSNRWTGDCTPGNARCNVGINLDTASNDQNAANTQGNASIGVNAVAGTANNGFGQINLTATAGSALYAGLGYGLFNINAIVNYNNPAGTTNAGTTGTQTLPGNPCGFIIAVYQGDTAEHDPNSVLCGHWRNCPTVP